MNEADIAEAEAIQAIAGGKRTSAKPLEVAGEIWLCWSSGVMQTERRAFVAGKLLKVRQNHKMTGWNAVVNGSVMTSAANPRKPHRFTTETKAMEAAVRFAKAN